MWYSSESGERPQIVDKTSSKVWVYVRRNITEETRETDGETMSVYVYEETKISKEIYDIIADQDGRISDVEDVITEIIGG